MQGRLRPRNYILVDVKMSHAKGQFRGVRPSGKHRKSVLRQLAQQKINNGDSGTAGPADRPAAMLQTGRCRITL